ncbi:hypothetical protein BCR22_09895 [Enterococcus plantarum]|nr:hypothetical protein BCR22_09895 [Enterococcus plantarum]
MVRSSFLGSLMQLRSSGVSSLTVSFIFTFFLVKVSGYPFIFKDPSIPNFLALRIYDPYLVKISDT